MSYPLDADSERAYHGATRLGSCRRPFMLGTPQPVTFTPIGVARTPFLDRLSAPRQPAAARGVLGTIELFPGRDFEHALADLDGWDHLWVIFWFHLNQGWRPKVLPPRSRGKRRG